MIMTMLHICAIIQLMKLLLYTYVLLYSSQTPHCNLFNPHDSLRESALFSFYGQGNWSLEERWSDFPWSKLKWQQQDLNPALLMPSALSISWVGQAPWPHICVHAVPPGPRTQSTTKNTLGKQLFGYLSGWRPSIQDCLSCDSSSISQGWSTVYRAPLSKAATRLSKQVASKSTTLDQSQTPRPGNLPSHQLQWVSDASLGLRDLLCSGTWRISELSVPSHLPPQWEATFRRGIFQNSQSPIPGL